LDPETHEIRYDLVPYVKLVPIARYFVDAHIGASIHLAPDIPNPTNEEDPIATPITFSQDQYDVAYFSKDEIALEEEHGPSMLRPKSFSIGAHTMYLPKMYDMLENGSFPLDAEGYVPGTPCTGDAECHFMCINDVCASEEAGLVPDGGACAAHDDCVSGSCSGCLLSDGDWCCTGGDSDHGSTPNGDPCERDINCASDRCTWNYTCEAKLENGASCGAMGMNDGDCASGECSYSWGGWKCAPSTHSIVIGLGGGSIQI